MCFISIIQFFYGLSYVDFVGEKKERYYYVLFDVVEGFFIMFMNFEKDINYLYK